ncbi:MAG: hypothetical protein ACFFCS_13160 [Candidatus Hodarchaeota archaeon]
MSYEDSIDQDIDEDEKFQEDEFSEEDIERELSSRLLVEKGEPLPIKKISVNLWKTALHGAKVGIKKGAQWQSKSRQFSPEMDIIGDVLYIFDEEKLIEQKAIKYYEVEKCKELGIDIGDLIRDEKQYESMIKKPFQALDKETKMKYLKDNNEKLPTIPAENDCKLVIALNQRYWDTQHQDKSKMEEVDSDRDGKADGKKYLENYLKRKFGEFADLNRRLILKVFRGMAATKIEKQGVWMGTIEQSLVDSMTEAFGEKNPLFSGVMTLPGYDYQIVFRRAHAITGQRFVLPVIERRIDLEELFETSLIKGKDYEPDSSEKIPTNYHARWLIVEGKRFSPGTDFIVKDPLNGGKKVATIDGRAIDIGGRWDIKFTDDEISKDPIVRAELVLFATMVKYHAEAQKVMGRLYKELKKKVKKYSDDQIRAALSMYLQKLEKKTGEKIPDKDGRIELGLKLLKSRKYGKLDIGALLRMKYDMTITPHELSMLFNPRRVRS